MQSIMKSASKKVSRFWSTVEENVIEPVSSVVVPVVSSAAERASDAISPITAPIGNAVNTVVDGVYTTIYPIPALPAGYATMFQVFPYNLIYPESRKYKSQMERQEALFKFMQNPRFRNFLITQRLDPTPLNHQPDEIESGFLGDIQRYQSLRHRLQEGELLRLFVTAALNFYADSPLAVDLLVLYGIRSSEDQLIISLYDSLRVGGGPRDRLLQNLKEAYQAESPYKEANQSLIRHALHSNKSLLYKSLEGHRYPLSLPALLSHAPNTQTQATSYVRDAEREKIYRTGSNKI